MIINPTNYSLKTKTSVKFNSNKNNRNSNPCINNNYQNLKIKDQLQVNKISMPAFKRAKKSPVLKIKALTEEELREQGIKHEILPVIPEKKSEEAAGMDITNIAQTNLNPGEAKIVYTGLQFQIPKGYELQIRARSGWGKKGLIPAAGIGTIDSDYTGVLNIAMRNISNEPISVKSGERFCQIVISPVIQPDIIPVDKINKISQRGDGKFGSTG